MNTPGGLPMFPLGSVLFPSMVLPLHIFEPRYRALIDDCLAGDREFGVTLIERGAEVGGDDTRSNIGCIAQVIEADQFDDGRWFVTGVGTRRFTVTEWLPDDPYPQAVVELIEEVPAVPSDQAVFDSVVAQLRTINEVAAQRGVTVEALPDDLSTDAALGSFQVATLSPLGAFDRQRVLAELTPTDRLGMLEGLLSDFLHDLRAL